MGVSESVRFWGFLRQYEDVVGIMSSATVFVNPSVFEGFGMSQLEAMAAGTPVVAYDLESYQEYARSGVNCLLTARYDFQGFVENVRNVLLHPDIARDMSEAGIETARQFSWKKMAEEVRGIYSSIIR
jgi:glycosyltransferase involved in cell wall biosynthesis